MSNQDILPLPSGLDLNMKQQPRRTDGTIVQIRDLLFIGWRLGMVDACDWIRIKLHEDEYGKDNS